MNFHFVPLPASVICQKIFLLLQVCVVKGEKLLQEKYQRVRTHSPCKHCMKICFPDPVRMTKHVSCSKSNVAA